MYGLTSEGYEIRVIRKKFLGVTYKKQYAVYKNGLHVALIKKLK